ncbi:hypothetical protein GGR57DRAFT_478419 [Xylariaceae sp. FL1272]|nr:hypothetical protein GGR57DRAFT_478419 [Xylariaceae sp. FL1272]
MAPSKRRTPCRTSARHFQSLLAGSSPINAICIDSDDSNDDRQTLTPTPARRKGQQKANRTISPRTGTGVSRDEPCLTVARTPPISGHGCLSRDTDAHRDKAHGPASLMLASGANATYGSTARLAAPSLAMPNVVEHDDDVMFLKESPRANSHSIKETNHASPLHASASAQSIPDGAMARRPLSIHTANAPHSPLISSHKLGRQHGKNMAQQMQSSPLSSGVKSCMSMPSLTTYPSVKTSSSMTPRTIPSTPARETLPPCTVKTPSTRGSRRDPYEIPSDSDSDDSQSQHTALPRSFAKIRSATLEASENAKLSTVQDAEDEQSMGSVLRDAHTWLKVSPLTRPHSLPDSAPQMERLSTRNCPSPDASPVVRASRPPIPCMSVPFTPPVASLKQKKQCEDDQVEEHQALNYVEPLGPRRPVFIKSEATTAKARYQKRIDQYFATDIPGLDAEVTTSSAHASKHESIVNQTCDIGNSIDTATPVALELVKPTSQTPKRPRHADHQAIASVVDSPPGSPILQQSDIAISLTKKRPRDVVEFDFSSADDPVARMGKKLGIDPDSLPEEEKKKKHRRRGKRFRKHKWDGLQN